MGYMTQQFVHLSKDALMIQSMATILQDSTFGQIN